MSEGQVQARAVVRVTLEIQPHDVWGMGAPIEQVNKQGAEAALGALRKLLAGSEVPIKILGSPVVSTVTFDPKAPT